MHVWLDVMLASAVCLGGVKALSVAYNLVLLMKHGATLRRVLEQSAPTTVDLRASFGPHGPKFQPVERFLQAHAGRFGHSLLLLYSGPGAITWCAVWCLLSAGLAEPTISRGQAGQVSHVVSPQLLLAAGAATAAATLGLLLTSLFRRLILGRYEAYTSDVQIPKGLRLPGAADVGGNLAVYFIMLAYLVVIGYASLDAAVATADPHAFAVAGVARTGFEWLYFSAITTSTVGYGDIHAQSTAAQILTLVQVASGPLFLTWMIAVIVGDRQIDKAPRDSDEADGL